MKGEKSGDGQGENQPASFPKLGNESRERDVSKRGEEKQLHHDCEYVTAETTCCNNLVFQLIRNSYLNL